MTTLTPDVFQKALDILNQGGLVAIPTETVYGLAADAENSQAVAGIYSAKRRPANHPLIVHLANSDALSYWASNVPEEAIQLTKAYWPGPLTIVLKRSKRAKDFITGGQDTVALRCPAHPIIRKLLEAFDEGKGRGLAAPSANSFGQISPTIAEHVREDLGEKPTGAVDLILDGGPCTVGIESTILDLSSSTPRILREGAITASMIEAVIGKTVQQGSSSNSPRVSGSLKSHYAPQHPLTLVSAENLAGKAQFIARHFQSFALIAPTEIEKRFHALAVKSFAYSLEKPEDLRMHLYGWMHELDKANIDHILVVPPPCQSEWFGVLDRLQRASVKK